MVPSGEVVLIVEDDEKLLKYFLMLFEQEGHSVLAAKSVAEARRWVDAGEVALAVVDYRLPDGTGGEVVHHLRERHPESQSIIVTAFGARDVILEAIHRGAFSYLEKPVDRETLLAYAQRALNLVHLGRENSKLQGHMKRFDEELNLKNRELEAISRIAALASESEDFSGASDEALTIVRDTLRADVALIYHAPRPNGQFILRNQLGLTEGEAESLHSLDAALGLVGRVGSNRRILVAENLHASPIGFLPGGSVPVRTPELRGLIGCPLASKGRLLGVLLAGYRGFDPIGRMHRVLIASLARQIGIALENTFLAEMAAVDNLTSLFNRRYLDLRLRQELGRAGRHGHQVALCLADIDRLAKVNETFGQGFGDYVLQGVSGCILRTLRVSDVAARYGGEEMAMVLPETNAPGGRNVAEKIRQAVEGLSFDLRGSQGDPGQGVTVSIGLSCFPEPGASPEEILDQADQALSRAKAEGRNRVVCYGEG